MNRFLKANGSPLPVGLNPMTSPKPSSVWSQIEPGRGPSAEAARAIPRSLSVDVRARDYDSSRGRPPFDELPDGGHYLNEYDNPQLLEEILKQAENHRAQQYPARSQSEVLKPQGGPHPHSKNPNKKRDGRRQSSDSQNLFGGQAVADHKAMSVPELTRPPPAEQQQQPQRTRKTKKKGKNYTPGVPHSQSSTGPIVEFLPPTPAVTPEVAPPREARRASTDTRDVPTPMEWTPDFGS
jgi:hypothetical protein